MYCNQIKVEKKPDGVIEVNVWDRRGEKIDITDVFLACICKTVKGERVTNELQIAQVENASSVFINFLALSKDLVFSVEPSVIDQILQVKGVQPATLDAIMGSGALRLYDVQNNDGGWEWHNPDRDSSTNPSPTNTKGVIAQGILDAYRKVGLAPLLASVVSAYGSILATSEDPDPEKHRIRGPDIPCLVELTEVANDPTYASFAKTRYQSALVEYGSGTATGFAEFIRDKRVGQNYPALPSWDINLYIQGCLALHSFDPGGSFDQHAKDMAEVIYACIYGDPVVFDITDPTLAEFWVGITGAIEAFKTAGVHLDKADELADLLVASQNEDGHFTGVEDGSDPQTTAYAILALLKMGTKAEAVAKAVDYLIDNQQANGSWNYEGATENTEVTSEAIQALYDFSD